MTPRKPKAKPKKNGRPLKFKTVKALEKKIDDYFTNCPDKRTIFIKDSDGTQTPMEVPCYTITGLALHLGFCDKCSLYDYAKKDEFSHSIKMARTKIERAYEMLLQGGQCTGAIFALKNFGWKDKQEVQLEGKAEFSLFFNQVQKKADNLLENNND